MTHDTARAPLIGITGRAGAGKDTIAEYLTAEHGYRRVAFADDVRAAALAIDPLTPASDDLSGPAHERLSAKVARLGWDQAKREPEVRRLLQRVGTEAGTAIHGQNTWITNAAVKITLLRASGTPVVITDVRFPSEAGFVSAQGGALWRVERASGAHALGSNAKHASEIHVDSLPVDLVVINDGTLDELTAQLDGIMVDPDNVRPRT